MKKYLAAAIFLTLMARPAYAYLDPGTGSMLVQGMLAALAAASVGVASFWTRIKLFFSGNKSDDAIGVVDKDDESAG